MLKSRTKALTVAAAISCALITGAHAAMTISNAKTKNVSCTGGVCAPTGGNANLNVSDLVTLLASSDVTVKSNAAAPDIGVLDALTWASAHRLTLDSFKSINVRAPVVVEGTTRLTLRTNDGGSGGDYNFNTATSGAITFWDMASGLVINGQLFKLVKDVRTLASDTANNPYGNYALAASYDAKTDGHYDTAPVGYFIGTLEGLGHSISNLSVRLPDPPSFYLSGLIEWIGKVGVVRDIGLPGTTIKGGEYVQIGALAGYNEGSILNCFSSGSIRGGQPNAEVGGLVGTNAGKIIRSFSSASVSGGALSQIGGLVGSSSGLIEDSHASGAVAGYTTATAGGLVGYAGGAILNSFATGDVSASFKTRHTTGSHTRTRKQPVVGGLVGYNAASISNSYATGGGSARAQRDTFITISRIGGLVGENAGSISTSYAAGPVQKEGGFSGGLIGTDVSQVAQSYWDFDTSGITDPGQGAGDPRNDPGITGLTDAQLKSALPAGFDPNVWGQSASINNGWPYLLTNPPQ